jgi:hypothetical protein
MHNKVKAIQELSHFRNDRELKIIARAATKYTAFVAKSYSKIYS